MKPKSLGTHTVRVLFFSIAFSSVMPLAAAEKKLPRFKRLMVHERFMPGDLARLVAMGTTYLAGRTATKSTRYPRALRRRPFAEMLVFQALASAVVFANELPRYIRLAHAFYQRILINRALKKEKLQAHEVLQLNNELRMAQREIDYLKPRITKKGIGEFLGYHIVSALIRDLFNRGERSVVGRYSMK